MSRLLTDLLGAGLIEKLEGNDDRFEKIERAATAVAQELADHPPGLIRAILAGLDPDVPANDPSIIQAEQALVAEWKAMGSVHTSPPVGIFRAILLEACSQTTKGNNAAIVWLTAADTLPLMRLGNEEPAVRRLLERLARRTEDAALVLPSVPDGPSAGQETFSIEHPGDVVVAAPRTVDRENLLHRVAAAITQTYRGTPVANPNRYAPHQHPGEWSWDFADRLHVLIATELDAIAVDVAKGQVEVLQRLQSELVKPLNNAITSQQRWVQEALKVSETRKHAEVIRLNVLWWSEAMYSQSIHCGYRDLSAPLAAVVMAVDLLDQVTRPTPASVGYLLAEAVNRLPDAEFNRKHTLPDLFDALRSARGRLPEGWLDRLSPPPSAGRQSLRDLVVLTLRNQVWDLEESIKQAGLTAEVTLSLPALARAIFRQEQAVLLAGSDQ